MIVGIFNELTDKTEYVYKLIIDGDALQIIYRSKRKVSRTINIAVADIESLQLEATKAHFSGRGWMIETITFITLKDGSIFSFEQKKPSSRPYFFSLLKHRDVFPNFDYKVNPQCKDFKLLNWEASVMLKKSYRLQTILLVIFFILLFLFLAFGHG
jgi:hypothetical protein